MRTSKGMRVVGLLLMGLSALRVASAGLITDVIDFSATDFTTNEGSGPPPFATITGEITVTLDPFYFSAPADCGYGGYQCAGAIQSLTVDSLSVAYDFPVTATYGGESWGPDGLIFQSFHDPNNPTAGHDFQVNIDGLSTGNLNFLGAGYGYYDPTTGGSWYITLQVGDGTATLVSSTAAETPEPSTWWLAAGALTAFLIRVRTLVRVPSA